MAVRSYPLTMVADRGRLPSSLFDPRWQDPEVAARVALEVYKRKASARDAADAKLISIADLPVVTASEVTRVRVALGPALSLEELGRQVRGHAQNELHRRYAYGGKVPARNYHAQVVTFAFDQEGRWLFRAFVGRFGGAAGDQAVLIARLNGLAPIGGAVIRQVLGEKDQEVSLAGRDPALVAAFAQSLFLELALAIVPAVEPEKEVSSTLDDALAAFDS